ncbi:MAG TPA: alpha/beta hydrolase [Beutenbergiaceae bacterium]|nr:alpha/beta hydrolase [Beutenbergiaceae bacterium]
MASPATTHIYRTIDVPVSGGHLRAGIWDPVTNADEPPTVLAIHGITATHQSWLHLPQMLPGFRIVAPDLRGRGRSNTLPGPYGMGRHADDLADLLHALGTKKVTAVGHSMGGFVAVVLSHRHPGLTTRLVLADGGLPLDSPDGVDPDAIMQAVLGPAIQRLAMTFPGHSAYREFWAKHPAFGPALVEELGAYFDYDLEPAGTGWRPSSRIEAVTEDQRELVTGHSLRPALEQLTLPTTFIHAPRGLLDDAPLYGPEHAEACAAQAPSITMKWARGVNHYTIVMSRPGAQFVAEQVAPAREGVQG